MIKSNLRVLLITSVILVSLFIVSEGTPVSASSSEPPSVSYSAYQTGLGWQETVKDSAVAGDINNKRTINAIRINLNAEVSGGVEYRAYIQGSGWSGWVRNGVTVGTPGSNIIERIQVRLYGKIAEQYDVHYRVYRNGGWTGFVKNGETSGGAGGAPINAFRITVTKKPTPFKNSGVPTIVNSGTIISNDYVFIPRFIKGVTKVETFGTGWSIKTEKSTGLKSYAFIPTSNSQKGKQGVYYRNVGLYKGKQIDLKITVLDWDSYIKELSNISYRTDVIGHTTHGYRSVKQKWEFIDHATGKPIAVNGYITINDIDAKQGVSFSPDEFEKFDNIYITDHSWLKYYNDYGKHKIYTESADNIDTFDKQGSFTLTFKNLSSITFSWEKEHETLGLTPDTTYDPNDLSSGQYFRITERKLAKTQPLVPEKYVRLDPEDSLKEEEIVHGTGKEFDFVIYSRVFEEYEEFYYSKYVIEDQVPSGLQVKNVRVLDESGKDVTHMFIDNSSGNKVSLQARPSVLKDPSFYGSIYYVEIRCVAESIKDSITSYLTFNNTAKLITAEGSFSTNTPSITVNRPPKAEFQIIPTETIRGKDVLFLNESLDPERKALSYIWEYRKAGSGSWTLMSTSISPKHSFTDVGNYEVRLTVIDEYGAKDTATKTVTVVNKGPKAEISSHPTTVVLGSNVRVNIDVQDPEGDDIDVDVILKGPGVEKHLKEEGVTSGSTLSFWFDPPSVGEYSIVVAVEDIYGDGGSFTHKFTVITVDIEGKVKHTDRWEQNRKLYNTVVSGDPESPRSVTDFFPGERFVLEAEVSQTEHVDKVEVSISGTAFSTELEDPTGRTTGPTIFEGSIWDISMISWKEKELEFVFKVHMTTGHIEEEVVKVKVVPGDYYRLKQIEM